MKKILLFTGAYVVGSFAIIGLKYCTQYVIARLDY